MTRGYSPADSQEAAFPRKTRGPGTARGGEVKAVIDIGSNSIKLRVVRRQGKNLRTLVDTTEVVRLGQGLESGSLAESCMERGVEVLHGLVGRAGELGATPCLVGTMALRTARNAQEFVRRVYERTGLAIDILSGQEEARLAWQGAIHGLAADAGDVVVFDAGGGSTEFIFGTDGRIRKSRSVPVGAVQVTERFFGTDAVNGDSLAQARQYIEAQFRSEGLPIEKKTTPFSVIGLGGGVVALGSVKLQLAALAPRKINGLLLTRSDIDTQVERYASCSLAERMRIVGLPPKRADIILASACIVQFTLGLWGANAFKVSINGLRHGLLLEMFRR